VTGRGLHGRQVAQALLIVALLPLVLVPVLVLGQPQFMGGFGDPVAIFISSPVTWAAAATYAVGLVWMLRIYRSVLDAESRPSSWRTGSG
jgi:hypothetical protein